MWGNFENTHSRPQRPRSFRSAPRIATSGPLQRHSGFEWLCEHNRLRPEPIRFVRLDSEHAQSDGKSMNRGLPVLDMARGRDSWRWPKGARPLGTRMENTPIFTHGYDQLHIISNSLLMTWSRPSGKRYTFSRDNQWYTREFSPSKKRETGKFLWPLSLLIRLIFRFLHKHLFFLRYKCGEIFTCQITCCFPKHAMTEV